MGMGVAGVPKDGVYYTKCAIGGFMACGLTHAAVVTLDVQKCRSQANPEWEQSMFRGIGKIWANEGLAGVTKGWVPTLWGYGLQGMVKFGANEVFQDFYGGLVGGKENLDAKWKKMALQGVSSGSAEFFADIALCPFEMTKVKIQVQLPGKVYEPAIPGSLFPAMSAMNQHKAVTGFPFKSLQPLWGRQIPYTMIKFVGFYQTAEAIYEFLESSYGMKKSEMSTGSQLVVTFAAGYWAGIFCAICTQPMDNLVSMLGAEANKGKTMGQLAGEMGIGNLFTKGLGPRILMIGTLTGLQWYIYGGVKAVFFGQTS